MSQPTTHSSVSTPVAMKAMRQPNMAAIHGTASGVMIAPTLEPALKMPMASARSRLGNHSLVAASAAGKVPASPSAISRRAPISPRVVVKAAWSMCPAAQIVTASA